MKRLGWWMVVLWLALAACAPSLGERRELPTAIPGVSSKEETYGTPVLGKPRPTAPLSGPTSTPAPFATGLPPPPPPPPPFIPHELTGRSDCLGCHLSPTYFGVPKDHLRRTNGTCRGCHALSPSAPQPTPAPFKHPVAGREQCLACHLQGLGDAPAIPGPHAGRANDTCMTCHHPKS
ncbi:MAG: hypothetical protein HZB53_14125 [Chloroflexi bacterium]|nr:hypothetical protein [Chloroflexota bacterium]